MLRAVGEYLKLCPEVTAFRMNSGALMNPQGRPVRFGVPGMSDYIGWVTNCGIHLNVSGCRPVCRRAGWRTARFLAIECKVPDWKPRNRADRERWARQQAFLEQVRDAGGIAGVVTSVEDARQVLGR